MRELEMRSLASPVSARAQGDSQEMIGGYALKFNKLSRNLGGFVEQIDPGALTKSAADGWPNVMARYNHQELLGTTASGSLQLVVDGTGLDYTNAMLSDATSQRVYALVQRGDVYRSSFAAYMLEDDWSLTPDGFPLRTIASMQLVDVAPVDDPAYYDTSTGLRSLAEARDMDITEVQEMARADRLADLLKKSPTVIDLGARDSDQDGQGETHPTGRLHVLRRALEMKKAV